MIQLGQFLAALANLVRTGGIKKVADAIRFAKQEFGEVSPLLERQIRQVFDRLKKPQIGKPGKKEGTVLPFIKEQKPPAEGEGLASLEELSVNDPMGDLEKILNPRRPGGGMNMVDGITRALARRILDKKGIEIGKNDPIEVFIDTFGESITDVRNLAEEMIEIDQRGGGMKDMDQMLEIEGLFDIEIPKNPNKGLTDEEMMKMAEEIEKENKLLDFDPTGRKPNAEGGLNSLMASVDEPFFRASDADEHSFRMFNKPYKELTPNELEEFQEEMMRLMNKFASAPDPMDERNSMMESLSLRFYGKPLRDLTEDEFLDLEEAFDDLTTKKDRGIPSITLAKGGLAYLMGM